MTLWRYHCRYCGVLVCHSCSANELSLDRWLGDGNKYDKHNRILARGTSPPLRVCDSCFEHAPKEMQDRRDSLAAEASWAQEEQRAHLGSGTQPWQLPNHMTVAKPATVREGISLKSAEVCTLDPGHFVRVEEEGSDSGHSRVRIRDGQWVSKRTSKGNTLLLPAPTWMLGDSSNRNPTEPPATPLVATEDLTPLTDDAKDAISQQSGGWSDVLAFSWHMPVGVLPPLAFQIEFGFVIYGGWKTPAQQCIFRRAAEFAGREVYVGYIEAPNVAKTRENWDIGSQFVRYVSLPSAKVQEEHITHGNWVRGWGGCRVIWVSISLFRSLTLLCVCLQICSYGHSDQYTVRLRALNEKGWSGWSPSSEAITPASVATLGGMVVAPPVGGAPEPEPEVELAPEIEGGTI